MDTIETTFRKIGSRGLIIFERDGTLLRRNIPSRDLTLGDVNNVFVQMLQQLRQNDFRFGFISDTRGMKARTQGTPEFLALTNILDDLLRVRQAMPDFWMTWDKFPHAGEDHSGTAGARSLLRAIEWYSVEKKEGMLVGSTAEGLLAAGNANITCIHYSHIGGDQLDHFPLQTKSPEITAIKWLNTEIERMLRSSLLRST
ncbi:hypothetical protein NIBR502774_18620 (plasmid) [Rhizobium sp. NIBRBAC000502774]|nr:hypothetical protein NIBR502774_18620 [Rhizobium sp. NIBRBAC000502774]